MVTLILKNLKEVEETFHNEIETICKEKEAYYKELFKRYHKNTTLEVIFNKSSAFYKVSVSIDLETKKVLISEEGKNPVNILETAFSKLETAVKKRYDLEKKGLRL